MRQILFVGLIALVGCAKPQYTYLTCSGTLKAVGDGRNVGTIDENFRINDDAQTIESMDAEGNFSSAYERAEFKPQMIVSKAVKGDHVVTINRLTGEWTIDGIASDKGKDFAVRGSGTCEKAKRKL